jgi:hypothetical protein
MITAKRRPFAGPPCPRTPTHGPLVRLNGAPAGRPYWCPHHEHDLEPGRPFFTVDEAAAAEAVARAIQP